MRVAVVGTGRMGAAMAGRLVAAGHEVTVQNRSRAKAEALVEPLGVQVADSPREAVAGAEVVVVSLPDDAALREAYLGPDGIVAGLQLGTLVADTSTVDPRTVQELAVPVEAAGGRLLDTPVSGSVATVESGQLLVMAGGDPADVGRAALVLAAFASRVVPLGPVGSGSTMKLAVNAMVGALNEALAEALVLAERSGIDRSAAYEVIQNSAVGAPYVVYKRQAFEHPEDSPVAFALELAAKDLRLATELADRVGAPMPQLAATREVVNRAVEAGLGPADVSAVAVYLRG